MGTFVNCGRRSCAARSATLTSQWRFGRQDRCPQDSWLLVRPLPGAFSDALPRQAFLRSVEREKLSVADSELLESPTPPLDQLPSSTDPKMWAVDGLHPSDEGYRIVGHWLAHALITSD